MEPRSKWKLQMSLLYFEGINRKVSEVEEELATDTLMTKKPVAVIAQVTSAAPAAKKAEGRGQQ
jgi:hypothetical protein